MFETLRRELTGVFAAKGMTAGLPKVKVDASQLKHLLDHYDANLERIRVLEEGIEREAADHDEWAAHADWHHEYLRATHHRSLAARMRALLGK